MEVLQKIFGTGVQNPIQWLVRRYLLAPHSRRAKRNNPAAQITRATKKLNILKAGVPAQGKGPNMVELKSFSGCTASTFATGSVPHLVFYSRRDIAAANFGFHPDVGRAYAPKFMIDPQEAALRGNRGSSKRVSF